MAGTSDATVTVLQWMADYFLHRNWTEFNSTSQISEDDKDILQGLFGILKDSDIYPANESLKQKWLFMVILCRLADGEDVTLQYEDGDEETPLQYMVSPFKKLVDLQETALKAEGENLVSDIKTEAVLVCCRAGAFDRAKILLNTEWKLENLDTEQKHTRRMLKIIVSTKNTQDETLMSYTYSQFLVVMKKYLEKIFKKFQKPLLLEAAEKKLSFEKSVGEAETNGRKRRCIERNFKADTIKKSQNKESEDAAPSGHNKAKLRKLWSQNVTELFNLSASSEPAHRTEMMPPPQLPTPRQALFRRKSQEPNKRPSTAQNKKESPTSTTEAEKPTTSCSEKQATTAGGSGGMTYKKNVGRPNRHEPEMSNQQGNKNKIPWDMESLNFSTCTSRSNRVKWTENEMEDFFDAVQIFGVGNWRKIADYLNTERTNVMLKDKWRNMLKCGDAQRLAKSKGKKT